MTSARCGGWTATAVDDAARAALSTAILRWPTLEDHGSDFDAELRTVLETYPWLVSVMRNADWLPRDDGMVDFRALVADRNDAREGLTALARALGLEPDEAVPPRDDDAGTPRTLRRADLTRPVHVRGRSARASP